MGAGGMQMGRLRDLFQTERLRALREGIQEFGHAGNDLDGRFYSVVSQAWALPVLLLLLIDKNAVNVRYDSTGMRRRQP